MAKKSEQQNEAPTIEQLRNEAVTTAFDQIVLDGLQLLTVFESSKYRTIVTVDHVGNSKYPYLVKECISYFYNLTLSKNKYGNYIIYISADTESISRFGGRIYNELLRSLFNHTGSKFTAINIEDSMESSIVTRQS